MLNTDNTLVNNDKEMASILNNTFSSIFTKENSNNLPTPPQMFHGSDDEKLGNINVQSSEIRKYLKTIDVNKSTGPDDISPRILKECCSQLETPLTLLFNKSLSEAKVPTLWKRANITPLFKKGDKKQANNYRPISLTSVLIKLLEKIIKDKLITFLETHELLNNNQHGFRSNRSCLTNLLDFFENVYATVDTKTPYDIIYLDFQKAFDKVPHNRLVSKLQSHGIGDHLCAWIKDWLSDRQQRVVLNGEKSEWLNVTSGVPQGSVLGPTLFLIYINDIDINMSSTISKFADDTKIGSSVLRVEDCEKVQADLDRLSDWSEKWLMPFNIEKCKVMHIGNRNPNFKYKMRNHELISIDQEKDLGVIINQNLKMTDQCTAASKKANRMLGLISRNFGLKSPEVTRKLYTAFVRPHLEYAVQFWSPNYIKDQNLLERVQRRATKKIPALRNLSYEDRLKRLDLFSLQKRRLRGDLIETFKILKGFDKINPDLLFQVDNTTVTRGNGMKLRVKRCNTEIRKAFFTVRVVEHWNKLPASVVDADTIHSFKCRLDKHFHEVGCY